MKNRIISLVGMSGAGKTEFCNKLNPANHFHYSVDYIISEFYLKNELTKNSSITDLSEISSFLGKIGSPRLGGIEYDEFFRRQKLYIEAEKKATINLNKIASKILEHYDYILNDLTGSICEIIDFNNENDEIFNFLNNETTIIYIKSTQEHIDTLIANSIKKPKPLIYDRVFLDENIDIYNNNKSINSINEANPNDFFEFIFPKFVLNRSKKYDLIGQSGTTISMCEFNNKKYCK